MGRVREREGGGRERGRREGERRETYTVLMPVYNAFSLTEHQIGH